MPAVVANESLRYRGCGNESRAADHISRRQMAKMLYKSQVQIQKISRSLLLSQMKFQVYFKKINKKKLLFAIICGKLWRPEFLSEGGGREGGGVVPLG